MQTSFSSSNTTSTQTIEDFIKKSTLNLELHASAEAGTKSIILSPLPVIQHLDTLNYPKESCNFIFEK